MGQNTYTANNTWTCPVGVTAVKVEVWAPGGGGAGANNNTYGAAGGKGGAFAQGNAVSVTGGANYTLRVPVGGAGGGNNANGTAGANAYFALASNNQVLVNAEGGGGATRGIPANTTAGGAANNCTGDVKYNGGAGYGGGNTVKPGGGGGGAAGTDGNGTASSNQTGGAAAGGGGNGGNGGNNNTVGNNGIAPGGGGGGGGNRTSGTKTGGTGGAAKIILTWTDPTFNDLRQYLINGITSAQSEAAGWNAEVRAKLAVTDVVRTSDTIATVTPSAQAGYNITAQETITVTVPAAILTAGAALVATPTFTVDYVAGNNATSILRQMMAHHGA